MIGTDFELLGVGETLLTASHGRADDSTSPEDRPADGGGGAVGAVVGRNPISFVVPAIACSVLGSTGYHWGLARKQAIIGWEAGGRRRPETGGISLGHCVRRRGRRGKGYAQAACDPAQDSEIDVAAGPLGELDVVDEADED